VSRRFVAKTAAQLDAWCTTFLSGNSALSSCGPHLQGASAADRVLEELECDDIADREIIDRRAFAEVGSMEENFAVVDHADEAVSLADEQLRDPSR
jgi:hypothetical protein